MSAEETAKDPEAAASAKEAEELKAPRTEIALRYSGASQVAFEGGKTTVALFGNREFGDVRGGGVARDPLPLREALSALHDVVSSDFRFIPKDRTAYMAYLQLKKRATAGANLWE